MTLVSKLQLTPCLEQNTQQGCRQAHLFTITTQRIKDA